ncbi:ead/Ea22-like family protein [Raoultella ornithinolytica]|uniref:Ead/Ea22-like family protein n=1 Tax=Raoultella ornithinolytica TaxID=54291 RepID=A0A9Q9JEQ7_RAOOR|nr:ead/Ea22-like family protein [Raoultella ornithinolytica]UXE39468.1 ead/Ea22-like family protein [Raoultella ornithinolytica]
MTTDITELALITKIKKQLENFDTVILKEDEALALVEALEKAQQYAKERDAENQDLMLTVGRIRVEREELESRTVKLPPCVDDLHGIGMVMSADAVVEALTSYGIKVEAE